MTLFLRPKGVFSRIDQIESRLFNLAAGFLLFSNIALTLSPAVRLHTWQTALQWDHWTGYAAWLIGFLLLQRLARTHLSERDPYLLPITAILTGWGLLEIWRLDAQYGLRQTIWVIVSIGLLAAAIRYPGLLDFLRRYKYIWLTAGLVLLGVTFAVGIYPGLEGGGPRLWLGCCGLYVQPSEPLKLLLIIYLAAYLSDPSRRIGGAVQLAAPTLILTGVALLLLLIHRDLGTAFLFVLLYAAMLFTAYERRRILLGSAALISIAALIGYSTFDVVRLRFEAWLTPWLDPSGRSFQVVQSLIAIATGGILGRGPGLGSPGSVPVSHSDFIFSAIVEESGLLGGVVILLLIGLYCVRGLRSAYRAPSLYQRYLGTGLSVYLAAQSLLIIGGNIRLFPLTGVTLPFVSYGGSSLVTSCVALALLLRVSHHPDDEPVPLQRKNPQLWLGSGVLAVLILAALVTGWWAVIRSPALITRLDNPRRAINDLYVPRGAIVDRTGLVLAQSLGLPGEMQRLYPQPKTVAVIGYTNYFYGQAGLESSLDPILRGLTGNPVIEILRTSLFYGQSPPGRDVRVSLDLDLQILASDLLSGVKSAAVVLNADSGEILALASQPIYDPNRLSEDWPELVANPDSPLLNRATQGQYPFGSGLSPFLLAQSALEQVQKVASSLPDERLLSTCLTEPPGNPSLGQAVSAGCAPVGLQLAQDLPTDIGDLLERLGFTQALDLPLDTAQPADPLTSDARLLISGQDGLLVSPLQVALAASSISSGGTRPTPTLVTATNLASTGWTLETLSSSPVQVFSEAAAESTAQALSIENSNTWFALGQGARTNASPVTWFIGGTQPTRPGTPLVVVVLIEEDNAQLVKSIGERLLTAAQSP